MTKQHTNKAIAVRTHVGRDLLQSAAMFKTDKLVVWEYVANGLQYREPGVSPVVNVMLDSRSKRIVIDDNGSGMDRDGLQHYFVMHGENVERKSGRAGRGRFGTGKSAAFGIANLLRVSTIRHGRRNTVELSRADIETAGEGEIRVRSIERDVVVDEPNGTVVTISGLNVRKLDPTGVIKYVERHLAHWLGKPLVVVNGHACEYTEPATSRLLKLTPTDEQREVLGDVELVLKVAKSPLEPELQGVAVYSNGVWLQTTLAGAHGQPMAQYIFGSIDVPALDDENSAVPAFDMSRSMELNPNNEVVQSLFAFVGFEVDRLRRELSKEERARRAQEEMKKLSREAEKIAEMINRDFHDFSDRLARVKARSGTGHDFGRSSGSSGTKSPSEEATEGLMQGGHELASEEWPSGNPGRGNGKSAAGTKAPNRAPLMRSDASGQPVGQPRGPQGNARQQQGGFCVEFKDMGEENPRASYVPIERTIYVNLGHPQIQAAKGSASTEDPVFRRLAYEVAFSEYAIALAHEMDNNGDFIEPSEAMVAIRETLNRMARRAASLYAT